MDHKSLLYHIYNLVRNVIKQDNMAVKVVGMEKLGWGASLDINHIKLFHRKSTQDKAS